MKCRRILGYIYNEIQLNKYYWDFIMMITVNSIQNNPYYYYIIVFNLKIENSSSIFKCILLRKWSNKVKFNLRNSFNIN